MVQAKRKFLLSVFELIDFHCVCVGCDSMGDLQAYGMIHYTRTAHHMLCTLVPDFELPSSNCKIFFYICTTPRIVRI